MENNRDFGYVKISFRFICEQVLTAITIISFVFSLWRSESEQNEYKWWILLIVGLFVLCIVIARLIKNWAKKECKAKASVPGQSDITIIIKRGSVLKQKGVKVIHVQDTFETRRDKCESNSLLHAFLTSVYYPRVFDWWKKRKSDGSNDTRKKELDDAIRRSLQDNEKDGENDNLRDASMNHIKYKIGTVAPYKKDYKLVSFSKMKDETGAVEEKDLAQYKTDVQAAFKGLSNEHNGDVKIPYNVGIWGFQYNGKGYDPMKRIEIMVEAFIAESRKNYFCDTLRICIKGSDANASKIDFEKVQVLLDYFCRNI